MFFGFSAGFGCRQSFGKLPPQLNFGRYTADGFVMHQDTPYVQGTAAIKEHTQELFDVLRVTKLDLTPVVVNGAEGVAYEVGVQEVAIDPPMDAFKSKRKHLFVYQRQEDGLWRIAAAMSSND